MSVCPVILCGGEGTRLWPMSRRDRPKPFVPLVGERSCFQQACARLAGMADVGKTVVVTGAAHEPLVNEQLAEIGLTATVVVEPEGRDSAPAAAAAAMYLRGSVPDSVAVVMPADHHIPDRAAFQRAAVTAVAAARKDTIVTFGIEPTYPGTTFGYIAQGSALDGVAGADHVNEFVEKPTRDIAEDYMRRGYIWNSGMFVFRPETFLDDLMRFEPGIVDAVAAAFAEARRDHALIRLGPAFRRATRRSIDHGVMEHTKRAAVVHGDFAWSDLGTWDAVYAASDKDAQGNAMIGAAVLIDTRDALVHADDAAVAVVGVSNVAVVVEPDAVLVTRLDAAHGAKTAVEALRARAHPAATRRAAVRVLHGIHDLKSAAGILRGWLDASALPVWWSMGADHRQGGFFEALDRSAHAVRTPRRMRVQARQGWTFVEMGLAGWPGPSRAAAMHAFDALEQHYRRQDSLYRTLVNDDGSAADDRALVYDQAFVMLAYAAAAKTSAGLAPMERHALAMLDVLNAHHAHAAGGFRDDMRFGSTLQANPHMHLLEAALAWIAAGGGGMWRNLAETCVRLARAHFVDADRGAVREFVDDTGEPVADANGRIVEPGHLFEWSHLLVHWGDASNDAWAREAAHRLYAAGVAHGVDPARHVAIDGLHDDMTAAFPTSRLWPQTEWLKAALALGRRAATHDERARFESEAMMALRALVQYLDMTVAGLWRDRLRPDGTFVEEPSPASSLYHIAGAILALGAYTAR